MEKDYFQEMFEQAISFEKSGQFDLAQNIYNVALQLLPETERSFRAQLLLRRGAIAYKLKNLRGAFDDFSAAMSTDPALARRFNGDFSKFYEEGCHCK